MGALRLPVDPCGGAQCPLSSQPVDLIKTAWSRCAPGHGLPDLIMLLNRPQRQGQRPWRVQWNSQRDSRPECYKGLSQLNRKIANDPTQTWVRRSGRQLSEEHTQVAVSHGGDTDQSHSEAAPHTRWGGCHRRGIANAGETGEVGALLSSRRGCGTGGRWRNSVVSAQPAESPRPPAVLPRLQPKGLGTPARPRARRQSRRAHPQPCDRVCAVDRAPREMSGSHAR